jgi:hypothetical protein
MLLQLETDSRSSEGRIGDMYFRQWATPKVRGHLESKERFAIKKYLLIIGKKKNMQVLSHTFTYFST